MDESSVARYLPHIQGYLFPKSRDRGKVRGSSQGRAEAGGRAEKRWERGVNQCPSLKPRDHCRFIPAVARAVREGFNRDACIRGLQGELLLFVHI